MVIYEELGDYRNQVEVRTLLLQAMLELAEYKEVRSQTQRLLNQARANNFQWIIASNLGTLGRVALAEEAYAEAWSLFQEMMTIARQANYQSHLGMALLWSGYAARGLGDLAQARHYLREALKHGLQRNLRLPPALRLAALLKADQADLEGAVELNALAMRHRPVPTSRWAEDVVGRPLAIATAALPPEVVAAAEARGQALDLHQTAAALLGELESG